MTFAEVYSLADSKLASRFWGLIHAGPKRSSWLTCFLNTHGVLWMAFWIMLVFFCVLGRSYQGRIQKGGVSPGDAWEALETPAHCLHLRVLPLDKPWIAFWCQMWEAVSNQDDWPGKSGSQVVVLPLEDLSGGHQGCELVTKGMNWP